jgi:hypothetical protein
MMGQAHETLPRDDGEYMKKAGKYEEGTFCAVPIVESGRAVQIDPRLIALGFSA